MNFIYIFADQWRRDAIGIYNPEVITPNIDHFANESMVFDRAYSSCPLCSPHRGSLLSGLYPKDTNVFTNCKPEVDAYLREEDICVSDVLKEHGYSTGYIGKWHLDKPDGSHGCVGWDAFTPAGRKRHGFDFWYSYGADNNHTHPHYWNTEGERIDVDQWSPDHETDVALDFIQKNENRDFALFISYNPPHSPYHLTPKEYQDLYHDIEVKNPAWDPAPEGAGDPIPEHIKNLKADALQGYYGAVTGLDKNIGRILDYLKEHDLYKDTYIVLSADHGDMMGDHQRMAKHIWYEGSVGIPLIIGGASTLPGHTDELIGSPDQTATILGLLGIDTPSFMQGRDFSPVVRREDFEGYSSVLMGCFPNTAERIEEFKAHGENFMDYGWRCVVSRDYKLAVNAGFSYGSPQKVYLYDRKNDPYENHNSDNPEVLALMMSEMKKWLEKTDDHFKLR